jgi:hypothetical protein
VPSSAARHLAPPDIVDVGDAVDVLGRGALATVADRVATCAAVHQVVVVTAGQAEVVARASGDKVVALVAPDIVPALVAVGVIVAGLAEHAVRTAATVEPVLAVAAEQILERSIAASDRDASHCGLVNTALTGPRAVLDEAGLLGGEAGSLTAVVKKGAGNPTIARRCATPPGGSTIPTFAKITALEVGTITGR